MSITEISSPAVSVPKHVDTTFTPSSDAERIAYAYVLTEIYMDARWMWGHLPDSDDPDILLATEELEAQMDAVWDEADRVFDGRQGMDYWADRYGLEETPAS